MSAPISLNFFVRERRRRLVVLGLALAGGVAGLLGGPAAAAPVRVPSHNVDSVPLGGISGIFDWFRNRDPLKNVDPDRRYKTKYGIITGREYEERVQAERTKAYEAALRAGETPGADGATVRRAKRVEKKIQKEEKIAFPQATVRRPSERVAAAAKSTEDRFPTPKASSGFAFKRGISSYRSPTREQVSASKPIGRFSLAFLKPGSRKNDEPAKESPPSSVKSAPAEFVASKPQRTAASAAEATVVGRTSIPGRGGVASETARVEKVNPTGAPAVAIVKAVPEQAPVAAAAGAGGSPVTGAPAGAAVRPATIEPKPVAGTAAQPAPAAAAEGSHARMSSKDKLKMAIFGQATESEEPETPDPEEGKKTGSVEPDKAIETARTPE